MNQPLTQQRIRIKFGKFGVQRFVGHLDTAKTWERILRRAQFPLEYTQGFNPRPRMQFAAALLVGVTSECEYLDTWLTRRLGDSLPGEWIDRLTANSPAGVVIFQLDEIPIRAAALPTLVTSAEYVIRPADDGPVLSDLPSRAAALLAQDHIERTSRDKTYDLRPLILDLRCETDAALIAHLKTGDQGNARPDELVAALGLELAQVAVHRRRLFLADTSDL
jgi:radical SAM-linked protein